MTHVLPRLALQPLPGALALIFVDCRRPALLQCSHRPCTLGIEGFWSRTPTSARDAKAQRRGWEGERPMSGRYVDPGAIPHYGPEPGVHEGDHVPVGGVDYTAHALACTD